jgi:glycosyltransferase involved in cell wall biosynthesis
LAGVPVVASAVDGTPEVIDDGATGRLFPPKRVEAIGETVRWMLSDPERAAATAASGRDACAEAFDAERMIDQLEALYEEVLGRVR